MAGGHAGARSKIDPEGVVRLHDALPLNLRLLRIASLTDPLDLSDGIARLFLPKDAKRGDQWLLYLKKSAWVSMDQKKPLNPGLYIAINNSLGWQINYIMAIEACKGIVQLDFDAEMEKLLD